MRNKLMLAMLGGLVGLACARAAAAEPAPASDSSATLEQVEKSEGNLTAQQRQVAERFRELEKLLLRMAELTAPTDPRRAALLRQAVAQSKQRDIDHQFEQLIELLGQDRLATVVKGQGEVQQDLSRLLDLLLSEDRSKRIETEKERVRDYLRRVNRIIKEQKSAQAETARDGDKDKLADQQGKLADKTGELADDVGHDAAKKTPKEQSDSDDEQSPGKDNQPAEPGKKADAPQDAPREGEKKDPTKEGDSDKDKPSGDTDDDKSKPKSGEKKAQEGSEPGKSKPTDKPAKPGDDKSGKPDEAPPSDSPPQEGDPADEHSQDSKPAQKRLQQAQERMREAQKKLEESKRADATEKQAEAIKELEQAKADLEEILRQLREEEMTRTLAMLETRFRKMLEQQIEVYEGTKRLDKVPEAERDRDDEIESGRLSRKESTISIEAEKALAVLHEEGSAVAFPEAVAEMRDDMEQVVLRLAQAKVGEVTQGIETDIIAGLEEMIASLQKAQKEMEKKAKQPQSAPAGEQDEPPLVDTLSELKMIRALQMRVNLRTERYAKMTETEQTDRPDLVEALKRLAEREQRIHQVTRDIVVGRNQ
jgi:hypothetical protein